MNGIHCPMNGKKVTKKEKKKKLVLVLNLLISWSSWGNWIERFRSINLFVKQKCVGDDDDNDGGDDDFRAKTGWRESCFSCTNFSTNLCSLSRLNKIEWVMWCDGEWNICTCTLVAFSVHKLNVYRKEFPFKQQKHTKYICTQPLTVASSNLIYIVYCLFKCCVYVTPSQVASNL